jgi:hypothetical protein
MRRSALSVRAHRSTRRLTVETLEDRRLLDGSDHELFFEISGYNDLLTRLGLSAPTGAGVEVAHESLNGTLDPNLDTDQNGFNAQFDGKTFLKNGQPYVPTVAGEVAHGTRTVAYNFFGNVWSIAPGVSTIYAENIAYDPNSLLPPSAPHVRVRVHAYMFGSPNSHAIVTQRELDYLVDQGEVVAALGTHVGGIHVVGLNDVFANGPAKFTNYWSGYNAIVVNQNAVIHETFTQIDVPGRIGPDLVAFAGTASKATARVGFSSRTTDANCSRCGRCPRPASGSHQGALNGRGVERHVAVWRHTACLVSAQRFRAAGPQVRRWDAEHQRQPPNPFARIERGGGHRRAAAVAQLRAGQPSVSSKRQIVFATFAVPSTGLGSTGPTNSKFLKNCLTAPPPPPVILSAANWLSPVHVLLMESLVK